MQKIILVGYMGSGKSTIGSLLAKKLELPFIDLDSYIERSENKSIAEIFKQLGEIYFRKLEHKYLSELSINENSFVLSLGGGTPCYSNNHILLQCDNCQSFYLQTPTFILVKRLQIDRQNRPLIFNLSDNELTDFVAKQIFERSYFYLFAKHIIKTGGLNFNEIIAQIEEKVITT